MFKQDYIEDLLTEHAYKTGTFTLSSGKISNEYVDVKGALLHPTLRKIVPTSLALALDEQFPDLSMVGLALGGALLAAMIGQLNQRPLLIIRSEPKYHGRRSHIEGLDNLKDTGKGVVLIDDIITTGRSIYSAIEELKINNLKVSGILALVDREEGAKEALSKDYRIITLTTLSKIRNPL